MALDGTILDSFWVALGFKTDPKGIKQFEAATEKLRGFVLKLGAALSAPALGAFVEEVAKGMGELQHFADLNKLSALEVAAFNRVAEENLIPMDSMESSIQSLNIKLGEAATGLGRGAMIFKKLGFQAKDAHGHVKSFDTILGDVSAKMEKLNNRSESLAIARRLGLDPKLVPLLEKGKASFDALVASAGGLNPLGAGDYKQAEDITKQFRIARLNIQILYREIAVKLFPVVQQMLEKFIAWFKAISTERVNAFTKGLEALGKVAESVWGDFEALIDIFAPVAEWFADTTPVLAMKGALYGLVGVLTALIAKFVILQGISLVQLGRMIVGFCATAIEWFTAFSIAELAALFPLYAMIGVAVALTAAVFGVYEAFKHWTGIVEGLGDALTWVLGGHSVTPLLRETHQSEPSRSAWNTPSWGDTHNSRATTLVHQISGTTINLYSSDPAKAGEAVRKELKPRNVRSSIRNAQSGKAI
jgi:hypothetical protein